jgi:hypothetical protein
LLNIAKRKQIYTDLAVTQVKPGEIGLFVDNFRALLIKPPKSHMLCEPLFGGALEKTGIIFQF